MQRMSNSKCKSAKPSKTLTMRSGLVLPPRNSSLGTRSSQETFAAAVLSRARISAQLPTLDSGKPPGAQE